MTPLAAAVRDAAPPRARMRGEECARTGGVRLEPAAPAADERVARVRRAGGLWATVRLFPGESAWDCDCDSDDEACEHAVAAALALDASSAAAGSSDPPAASGPAPSSVAAAAEAPAALGYRFRRVKGGVALERVLVRGGAEEPFAGSLLAAQRGIDLDAAIAATREDVEIERVLAGASVLVKPLLARLLPLLAGRDDLRLDGAPVRVVARPLEPVFVRIEDQDGGFRAVVVRNPALTEILGPLALCGDALRPLAEVRLTAPERERLPRGVPVPAADVGDLVSRVLPDLAKRAPVEIVTRRLPGTTVLPPRALVETSGDRETLTVRAQVVYGRPVAARLEDGRLVHLAGPVPVRDSAAEQEVVRALEARLGLVPERALRLAGDAAVAFAERLRAWDGEIAGDAHRAFFLVAPLEPAVAVAGGNDAAPLAFTATFTSRDAAGAAHGVADPARVVAAWQRGATLVALDRGGFAPLPADWLQRHGALVADLLAARRADGTLPAAAVFDAARLARALGGAPPPHFEALRALAEDFAGLPAATLPADLDATLRPYQRAGVDRLAFVRDAGFGALLADDMGLGKTLQALCVVRGRTLVACPASVVFNWEREARRFRPALSVCVYHGRERRLDPAADLVVTTHAVLRNDRELLAKERWDAAIVDEAQAMKNPDSQLAEAACALDARFRLALTGTPVENRLAELWSLMRFTNPGLLGPRSEFEARWAAPVAAGDAAAAARLAQRLRPFVLRRLKREVAPDLPPRTEIVLRCELSPEEQALYDAVRAASRAEVVRLLAGGGSPLAALEALLRLRQAACHPALLPGRTAASSSKVELLLETLETPLAEGHKVLVFSQWTSLLDLVEPHLVARGVPFTRLDGSTADRAAVIDAFQDPAGPPVLLVSLKAGGVGLNLTAADHVVLLDPWWNPAAEDQAIDRAHRIGQDRPVLVARLVADGTVEERVLALQEHKRGLADAALGGAATEGAALTREDLMALVE